MKKSLIIEEKIHTLLKEYCDKESLKINKLVEKLIIKHIEDERKKMSLL
jgi:predicted DNA-binding ribbon-helix-helix protein